jgi:hypothetical protein
MVGFGRRLGMSSTVLPLFGSSALLADIEIRATATQHQDEYRPNDDDQHFFTFGGFRPFSGFWFCGHSVSLTAWNLHYWPSLA